MTHEKQWRFRAREGGYERTVSLWLYPELNLSSCVGDADDQSAGGQPTYYIETLRQDCKGREHWEADAVPVYWFIRGGDNVCEFAPNCPNTPAHFENFLTHFTHPVDAGTAEPVNWWRLPVRNAKALGWAPSAFQRFAPLRSIVTNRTEAASVRLPRSTASILTAP